MPKVSGSHLIVESLKKEGIKNLFILAGDHILPVLDVMEDFDFKFYDTRHEQSAVHMADAWNRITGQPGVSMVTTPGHANAIPGLANALHHESAVVHISGSAESENLGMGSMQEIDQIGMAAPVVKGAWQIPSVARIPEYIAMAFRTALSSRKGPVHLTIPIDLQKSLVDENDVRKYEPQEYRASNRLQADRKNVGVAIKLLNEAEKPMIFAGPSAGYSASTEQLSEFIDTTYLPLFTEDQARGLVSDNHPYCFGFGYLALNEAAKKIKEADVVLLLGKKLDFTLNFGNTPPFKAGAKIIQVDPSEADIGRSRGVSVPILGDIGSVLDQFISEASKYKWKKSSWLEELRSCKDKQESELEELADDNVPMHAMSVHKRLRKLISPNACFVFDGGDFNHFARSYYPALNPNKWVYLSTLGMIGTGVPVACAAKIAYPDDQVFLFTGDGSFGFNGMEYDTAVRHDLPFVGIMGNDGVWGIDYHIQMGLYQRPVATELRQSRYDQIVQALGGHGELVSHPNQLESAVKRSLESGLPSLINVTTKPAISALAAASILRNKG